MTEEFLLLRQKKQFYKGEMMKKIVSLILLGMFTLCFAKDYEVKMLNIDGAKNTMVFEPAFVKIEVGDSVTFVPAHKGHHTKSVLVPEGAENFGSLLNEKKTITFKKEGIYLYVCPPHQMMNMVGIIQVGKATNIKEVESSIPKLEERAASNKGRWLKYAKEIQK